MRKVLSKKFFERSAVVVAKDLLGKFLVIKREGREASYIITETEAYHGHSDKASHASKGRTERNDPMFGKPGYWYIYLIYGMYWMLNIVTGKEKQPSAVLIRDIESYDGPGKLTKALKITKSFNTIAASKKFGLWIEDRGIHVPSARIVRTPRIGVAYAEEWAEKLYRFHIKK